MNDSAATLVALALALLLFAPSAFADDVVPREAAYAPSVSQPFPTRVFWGDTHLHTNNSLDARSFGVTLGPRDAYRFARGDEVVATHGQPVKLSRPLDFLVVSDHSDGMGAMKEIVNGNEDLLRDPVVRDWRERLIQGGEAAAQATYDVIVAFTEARIPDVLRNDAFAQSIWDEYLRAAEEFNAPGLFTAFAGYEWTPTENGNNLHRNVIYRDGAERAGKLLPFTTFESFNPEDLWAWMERYESETGGQVLALAHNGNVSNGIMFPVEVNHRDQSAGHPRLRRDPAHPLGAALRGHADQGRRRGPSVRSPRQ